MKNTSNHYFKLVHKENSFSEITTILKKGKTKKIETLAEVEQAIIDFSRINSNLSPDDKKYWIKQSGLLEIFEVVEIITKIEKL